MPVEVRELIIRASIDQKAVNANNNQIDEELIEKIKQDIRNEVISEMKDIFDEILYKK
jgi:hypothetical protein